jgi:acyl-CoA synthetase (AMP-forming)/AMP-acid ligase II/acyl carrier protein
MDVAGQYDGAAAFPQTLPDLLDDLASRYPEKTALEAPGRPAPLTYSQLAAHTARVGQQLRELGVCTGDRLALVLENGPEIPAAFLAVTAAATCAPLNPAYSAPEFEFYLTDLRAKALIVGDGMRSASIDVARSLGIQVIVLKPDPDAGTGSFSLISESSVAGSPDSVAGAGSEPPAKRPSPNEVALVLHTSGTTSRPKIVPLTHANLCASARNVRQTLGLDESDRCLNVMPLFHIHGLVAATLASLSAGGTLICSPGFLAPEFFGWVDEIRPTWYTAVPTIHQAVLSRAAANREIIARRPLRFIRSSSSALPRTVMAELEQVFGVPVVEAYGMTEAAHQMCCNPLPPGIRKAGTVGPAAGPEVAVMNSSGQLLPRGESGEIVIRGENVTAGYENHPEANAAAFINGWFRTGDQGCLDSDGYLSIIGRIKEIINRGGEKISPREIDEVLLGHPSVAQSVAFGVPHSTLGEEVAAAVVLRPQADASESELVEFAASRLVSFKVPSRILLLDQIPRGPTGKIQRIGLAAWLGLVSGPAKPRQTKPPRPYVAPRSDLEKTIAGLWKEILKVEPISINDRFLELGGDSILAGRITARLCAQFEIELPMPVLFATPTVAGIAEVIERKTAQTPDDAELERYLAAIEDLSDEEAERLLSEEAD